MVGWSVEAVRVGQQVAHDRRDLTGVGPVDDPVVGRRDEHEHRPGDDLPVDDDRPLLHKEPLKFETVKLATRSYK